MMFFSKPIKTYAPKDVHDLMAEDGAVLVDVRERAEHDSQSIPSAHLMPLSSFDPANLPDWTGKTLVLHCRSGMRSARAARACLKAGIADVTHMGGGIIGWCKARLPIQDAKSKRSDTGA